MEAVGEEAGVPGEFEGGSGIHGLHLAVYEESDEVRVGVGHGGRHGKRPADDLVLGEVHRHDGCRVVYGEGRDGADERACRFILHLKCDGMGAVRKRLGVEAARENGRGVSPKARAVQEELGGRKRDARGDAAYESDETPHLAARKREEDEGQGHPGLLEIHVVEGLEGFSRGAEVGAAVEG